MAHRRTQFFVALLALIAVLSAPRFGAADEEKLNINTASAQDLTNLRGIGDVTAKAIVAYREEHGPFQRVEDLVAVRGIGEKTLAGFKDRLTVGEAPAAAAAKAKPGS